MQGIVFYYSSLANPAQAENARAAHFQPSEADAKAEVSPIPRNP